MTFWDGVIVGVCGAFALSALTVVGIAVAHEWAWRRYQKRRDRAVAEWLIEDSCAR